MDSRKKNFLTAVVGHDGARALAKAADLGADVEWAVFPRAVLSWLNVASIGDYDGLVPGTKTHLTLKKTEAGFKGSVSMPDGSCVGFLEQPLTYVASTLLLSVSGVEDPAPPLTSPSLARLGKSIDLLVRSRTLRSLLKREPVSAPPATVNVSRKAAQRDCSTCGSKRFAASTYKGCACFTGLAKSVSTTTSSDGYTLTLGPDWTEDDRLTLAEGFSDES